MKSATQFIALLKLGGNPREILRSLPQWKTPYINKVRNPAYVPDPDLVVNPASRFPPRSSVPVGWSAAVQAEVTK